MIATGIKSYINIEKGSKLKGEYGLANIEYSPEITNAII